MDKYKISFKLGLQIKELLVREEAIDDSIEEILECSQKDRSEIIKILEKERSRISRELTYSFRKVAQLQKIPMMIDVFNDVEGHEPIFSTDSLNKPAYES